MSGKVGKEEDKTPPPKQKPRRRSARQQGSTLSNPSLQNMNGIGLAQALTPEMRGRLEYKKNVQRAFDRTKKRGIDLDEKTKEYVLTAEGKQVMSNEPTLNESFARTGGEGLFNLYDNQYRAGMAHHLYTMFPEAVEVSDQKIARFILTKVWLFLQLSKANPIGPDTVKLAYSQAEAKGEVPKEILDYAEYKNLSGILLLPAGLSETVLSKNLQRMYASFNHSALILDEKKEKWSGPADTIVVLSGPKGGPHLWTIQVFARNPKGQGNILVGMRHYYSREQALTGIATMEWIYEHFGEEGLFGLIFDSFYASWEALCFLEEKGIKFLASLKSSWYKSVHDLLSKVLVDMNDEVVAHMTVADLEKHTNHLAGRYEFAQGGVKFTVGDEDLSDLAKELNKGKQKKDAVAVLEDNRAKLIEKKEKLLASMAEVDALLEENTKKSKFLAKGHTLTVAGTVAFPFRDEWIAKYGKPAPKEGQGARASKGTRADDDRAGARADDRDADLAEDAETAETAETIDLVAPRFHISCWHDPGTQKKSLVASNMHRALNGVVRAHGSDTRALGKASRMHSTYNQNYGMGSDNNNNQLSWIDVRQTRRRNSPMLHFSDHAMKYPVQSLFHYFTGTGRFNSLMLPEQPDGKKTLDYKGNFKAFMEHTVTTGIEMLPTFSDDPISRFPPPGEGGPPCTCTFCAQRRWTRADILEHDRYLEQLEADRNAKIDAKLKKELATKRKKEAAEEKKAQAAEKKRKAAEEKTRKDAEKKQRKEDRQAQFDATHSQCAGCDEPVNEKFLWGCNNAGCGRWFGSTCCAGVKGLTPAAKQSLKRNHWDCPTCTELKRSINLRSTANLRAELRRAGLSPDGAKPALVRRLLEATCGPAPSAESAGDGDTEMLPAAAPATQRRRRG